MQGKRVVAKLNDLNHHREQSTEISCVGFSDPLNSFVLAEVRHMQQNRDLIKLNDLNHLLGQSTEIWYVGFSDPKNNSVLIDF